MTTIINTQEKSSIRAALVALMSIAIGLCMLVLPVFFSDSMTIAGPAMASLAAICHIVFGAGWFIQSLDAANTQEPLPPAEWTVDPGHTAYANRYAKA